MLRRRPIRPKDQWLKKKDQLSGRQAVKQKGLDIVKKRGIKYLSENIEGLEIKELNVTPEGGVDIVAHVPHQDYKATIGGKKSAQTGVAVGSAGALALAIVGVVRSTGVTLWPEERDAEMVIIITTVLSAVIRFGTNWLKNRK